LFLGFSGTLAARPFLDCSQFGYERFKHMRPPCRARTPSAKFCGLAATHAAQLGGMFQSGRLDFTIHSPSVVNKREEKEIKPGRAVIGLGRHAAQDQTSGELNPRSVLLGIYVVV
jgi:hypothetical protein